MWHYETMILKDMEQAACFIAKMDECEEKELLKAAAKEMFDNRLEDKEISKAARTELLSLLEQRPPNRT